MEKINHRGSILIILLFLIIVIALVGVWSLTSTRTGLKISGHYHGSTKLVYEAEEGLRKAVLRIQLIVDPFRQDPLFANSLYGGGVAANEKTIIFFVADTIPPEDTATYQNIACPEPFDEASGLDAPYYPPATPGTSNVVCNFLGTSMMSTQVILVRKSDFIEGSQSTAVYLINSIARDATGRKQIVQGVVMIPYVGVVTSTSGLAPPPGQMPYLATTLKGGAD